MKTTRRDFIVRTAVGTASLGLMASYSLIPKPSQAARKSDAPRPNFVYIFCDDLGYGDLGCFGHPIINTPCLDSLAAEGMKLTDCYASAPVCSPSRAGVMTGRNPYRCSIPDWIPHNSPLHLQSAETTVAKRLKDAGYTTIHSGKWHLSGKGFDDGSQPSPGDHGFDHWFSTQNNALPSHHNPKNFIRNDNKVGPLEGYSSTIIVDEAMKVLDRLDGDQPFALFVWFHAPHEPIATAKRFMDMYSSASKTEAEYYGNVSQMDHETGRLLDYLDKRDLRDNTFVMFTSDNGPETLNRYRGSERSHGSPGPLRGMKLHIHEGGIRVPGIIRWPGKTIPGQVCREPVNGTDVLPTFCELAGADLPSKPVLDGTSITPIFEGKPIQRRRPLYWRYDRALSKPKIAMRDGDWKILSDLKFTEFELYNLKNDLRETTNLAGSEPERLEKMLKMLKAIHREVENDPVSAHIHDPRDKKKSK